MNLAWQLFLNFSDELASQPVQFVLLSLFSRSGSFFSYYFFDCCLSFSWNFFSCWSFSCNYFCLFNSYSRGNRVLKAELFERGSLQ